MHLEELQKRMAKALQTEQPQGASVVYDDLVKVGERSPEKQISIYRSVIRTNHYNALSDTYPACHYILGEKLFKQLSGDYFSKCPTIEPNMNFYGEGFDQYLREYALEDCPTYIPDLAHLEWCWQLLSQQEPVKAFDTQSLSGLQPEQLADIFFTRNPTCKFIYSDYPLHMVWDAALNQSQIVQQQTPVALLLWLRDEERYIRQVDADQLELLSTFPEQISLNELLLGQYEQSTVLQALQSGWVVSV